MKLSEEAQWVRSSLKGGDSPLTEKLSLRHGEGDLQDPQLPGDAELPLEVLEVAVEDPPALVEEAAEDDVALAVGVVERRWVHAPPDDPGGQGDLVGDAGCSITQKGLSVHGWFKFSSNDGVGVRASEAGICLERRPSLDGLHDRLKFLQSAGIANMFEAWTNLIEHTAKGVSSASPEGVHSISICIDQVQSVLVEVHDVLEDQRRLVGRKVHLGSHIVICGGKMTVASELLGDDLLVQQMLLSKAEGIKLRLCSEILEKPNEVNVTVGVGVMAQPQPFEGWLCQRLRTSIAIIDVFHSNSNSKLLINK